MPSLWAAAPGTSTGTPLPVAPANADAWDWTRAAVIFLVAISIAQLARRLLARRLRQEDDEHRAAETLGRVAGFVIVVAGFVYALSALDVRLGPLLGALGIGGIALAFALQDILENFIAGLIIQARRPFRRGDEIRTHDYVGRVEDVNLRTVIIRTFDGERVLLPNAMVLKAPVENHTALGQRRSRLFVSVGYRSDLRQVKTVLESAAARVTGVSDRPEPTALFEEFGDSALQVSLRFWHDARSDTEVRVRDAVGIAVKEALDRAGIEIPFPQRIIWLGGETVGSEIDLRAGGARR